MIIGTSPNGIFKVDTKTEKVEWVQKGNFFGVSKIGRESFSDIFVAERKEWGTLLRQYNSSTLTQSKKQYVKEAHDVHQIYSYLNDYNASLWILVTDTKHNRIVNILPSGIKQIIDINEDTSKDINHVNAVGIDHNSLIHIGLNNRGNKESQVIKVLDSGIDVITLEGVYHTHDLEPYQGDMLISASHQGFVYSLNRKEPLFYTGDVWTRGITVSVDGIWVGYSAVSPRSSRQDPSLKNSINLFSHHKFELIKNIEIEGAGQINDLVWIE